MQPIAILEQQPKLILIVEGIVLWVLVGVGDYFVTHRLLLEFSVFFLIPVSFFSWFMGWWAGCLISVLSAAVILAANLTSYAYTQYPRVGAWNALIWLGFFLVVAAIIRELRVFQMRLQRLSRVDSLTGVSNRMAFSEFAEAEKNRARRDKMPLTIAYVDVDYFKEINDKLGHVVGDSVLVMAAQTLLKQIRHTDAVARIGGDEFALVLPNTRQESAKVLLDKLSQLLMANMKERVVGYLQHRRRYVSAGARVSGGDDRTRRPDHVHDKDQRQEWSHVRRRGCLSDDHSAKNDAPFRS